MSTMLVELFHPIGVVGGIFRDMEVSLRQRPGVAKAASSVSVGDRSGGFDVEWMVSAWDAQTQEIRTWSLWLYWDHDAWVIDRRLAESSDSDEIYLAEFDDLHVGDGDLGATIVAAATELVMLDPPRPGTPPIESAT